MEAHVADWKKEEVKELTNLFTKNRVGGIPAPQMQQMRKNLQGSATIRSAKNNLILRALDEAEKSTKGVSELKDHVKGQSAIIATEMNPFKLFSKIKGSRTMAPAKGGEKATHNIEVKSGETPFKPGPIVGELQKAGIPAAIIEGKVVVKTDKVVVPQGERIPKDVAQMLTRLEIFPIEIGMTLNGVFEAGEIFSPDVLDINIDEFFGRIRQASINVLNLAITAGWTTKQTIQPLLMKAHHDAFTIALEMGFVNKETVKYLISKANNQMLALKNKTT